MFSQLEDNLRVMLAMQVHPQKHVGKVQVKYCYLFEKINFHSSELLPQGSMNVFNSHKESLSVAT